MRQKLGPLLFAQEFGGEFIDAESSAFSFEMIELAPVGDFERFILSKTENLAPAMRTRSLGRMSSFRWRPDHPDSMSTVYYAPMDLYGAFPCQVVFSGLLPGSLFGAGRGRSPSRRLRSGSRSARKGSRDRNVSGAWRRAALAELVFRSALTPEHAEGG